MNISRCSHVFGVDDRLARVEIERDFELLDRASSGASIRVWSIALTTVVLGVSLDLEREVDLRECERLAVGVVRRASGGGAVVIGAGTLQYAIALPYDVSPQLATIPGSKRFCNAATIAALRHAGAAGQLTHDDSGDVCREGRKIAGVALKRSRHAMLLHGTVLLHADIDEIGALLRHPRREPAYREGRSHRDFLANLGMIDRVAFEAALADELGVSGSSVAEQLGQ